MAEGFAAVDVADVDLHHWSGDGRYGIGNGDRRVGVAASVEDDAAVVKSHGLQPIHDFPLDITLIGVDRVLWKLLGQFLQILVERAVAIHLGLTHTHEVQVRAVDDVDDHITS